MEPYRVPTARNTARSQRVLPLLEQCDKQPESAPHQEKDRELANRQYDPSLPASASCLIPASGQISHPAANLMYIPPCMLKTDSQLLDLLQNAASCPPCTPATLRELDLHSIQNNLNLRIDICYDHDLFFQPISGRKGDVKRIEAEKYWLALAAEFKIYQHNLVSHCLQCAATNMTKPPTFTKRLSVLFANLKEIVDMLTPESDHEEVANHLDLDLLMQQIEKGALDIVRLAEWLTALLTSHCAPMRDGAAKEVALDIRNGTEQFDMPLLMQGIEKLFALLESMKLDIANHQIRAFRYPLIEDTVAFQRDYFARAIETEHINMTNAQRWYQSMRFDHQRGCASVIEGNLTPAFRSFIHAMVRLCDPRVKRFPTTFKHDNQRFIRLQEDLQDLTQIDHCLVVFNSRLAQLVGDVPNVISVHDTLKSRIIYLTEDEDGNGGAISDHLDAIGLEITQTVLSVLKKTPGCRRIVDENEEFERTSRMLSQIFEQEEDTQFGTKRFLALLEQRTGKCAQTFLPMSTLEISHAQRQWNQKRTTALRGKESLLADWEDMARRLAHLGVLHWRVWADICYLQHELVPVTSSTESSPTESDFFGDSESTMSSPSTCGSATTFEFLDNQHQSLELAQHTTLTIVEDREEDWSNIEAIHHIEDRSDVPGNDIDVDVVQRKDLDGGKSKSPSPKHL